MAGEAIRMLMTLEAGQVIQGLKQMATGSKDVDEQNKKLKGSLDTVQKGSRELGQALGIVSPELGRLGAMVNDAAGAMEFLSTANAGTVSTLGTVTAGVAGFAGGLALAAPAIAYYGAMVIDARNTLRDFGEAHDRVLTMMSATQAKIRDLRKMQLEAAGDLAGLREMQAQDASGLTQINAELDRARINMGKMARDASFGDQLRVLTEHYTGINLFAKTAWENSVDQVKALEQQAQITETSLVPGFDAAADSLERSKKNAEATRDALRGIESIDIKSALGALNQQMGVVTGANIPTGTSGGGMSLVSTSSGGVTTFGQPVSDVVSGGPSGFSWAGGTRGGALSDAAAKMMGSKYAMGAMGLMSGNVSGMLGAMGPWGAAIGGISQIGQMGAGGVRDQLEGFTDAFIAGLEALPEILAEVIPDFVESIVSEMIPALIAASPRIFLALIEGLADVMNPLNDGILGSNTWEKIGGWARTGLVTATGGFAAGSLQAGKEIAGLFSGGERNAGPGRRNRGAVVFNGPVIGSSDALVKDMERRYSRMFGTARSTIL